MYTELESPISCRTFDRLPNLCRTSNSRTFGTPKFRSTYKMRHVCRTCRTSTSNSTHVHAPTHARTHACEGRLRIRFGNVRHSALSLGLTNIWTCCKVRHNVRQRFGTLSITARLSCCVDISYATFAGSAEVRQKQITSAFIRFLRTNVMTRWHTAIVHCHRAGMGLCPLSTLSHSSSRCP